MRAALYVRVSTERQQHAQTIEQQVTQLSVVIWVGPAGRHTREQEVSTMQVVVARCAALDGAKAEVVACARVPGEQGGRRQLVRTFPGFTSGLEDLADWLAAEGVTQVVMEATGQYWKPCWWVLEERGFQLMLVNARHVKVLPGRKTDVGDAAWLCELLECGLLRGSFVPPAAIRQLRDLTR